MQPSTHPSTKPNVNLTTFEGIANAGFEFAVVGKPLTYLGKVYAAGEILSDPENPRRLAMLFKQRRIAPVAVNPPVSAQASAGAPTASQSKQSVQSAASTPPAESGPRKFGRRAKP